MSEKIQNNFSNIFIIPCDECYSLHNYQIENCFTNDTLKFSFSNINNNDSVSYHNFNFTTLLKLNWRNMAKKLLTKSKNKMKKLLDNSIITIQN